MIARLRTFGLLGLLGLFGLAASTAVAAPGAKVDICHNDGTGRLQVINISENAAPAHLTNHGDSYPATWWPDVDGDGFGDPAAATDRCPQPGLVSNGDDCAVDDPAVNPAATEVPYDGVDNDCSADSADDDLDRDGFLLVDDCNDQDASVNPNASETAYDGVDNDCNPATPDDDLDGDGFLIADDCNDNNAGVNPGVTEVCGDSMDNNCEGSIDEGCVQNDCPCFTSEQILAQWNQFNAGSWQSSYSGCQEVDVDYGNYYSYSYDYTYIYWGGYTYDGISYDSEYDYYYSIDYDDYYDATYCHGNSTHYGWDNYGYNYYYHSDFYSFQYLTQEQHASCEALLRDTSALLGITCAQYTYP